MTEQTIQSGEYATWISRRERLRLLKKGLCASHVAAADPHAAAADRLQHRPLRDDYERVNGFDENFVGWGLEDRDLQVRLGQLGLRFRSIVLATAACHLWHRPHPTFARNNEGTANLCYFQRQEVPSRCRNGLVKDGGDDLPDARRHQGQQHLSGPHFPLRTPAVTPWETARRGD